MNDCEVLLNEVPADTFDELNSVRICFAACFLYITIHIHLLHVFQVDDYSFNSFLSSIRKRPKAKNFMMLEHRVACLIRHVCSL